MTTVEIIKTIEGLYTTHGPAIALASGFLEVTPIGYWLPGGTAVIIGGFYSFGNTKLLFDILLFGFLGTWVSFMASFMLGKKSGNYLVKKLRQEKNAKKAEILLKSHGAIILTTSMMAGLTRFWVAYVAGAKNYSLLRFLFYSTLASLSWTSLMITIGYLVGAERGNLEGAIAGAGILGWVFLAVAGLAISYSIKKEYENFKENK